MGRCSFLRRESRAWTFSRGTADGNKERLRPPPATFARLSFAPLTPPCAPPGTAGASPQRPRHTVSHDIFRGEERSAHCWGPPGGGGSAAPPPSSPPCTRPQRDTAARRKDALLISRPLQPVPLATRATRSSTPPPRPPPPSAPPLSITQCTYMSSQSGLPVAPLTCWLPSPLGETVGVARTLRRPSPPPFTASACPYAPSQGPPHHGVNEEVVATNNRSCCRCVGIRSRRATAPLPPRPPSHAEWLTSPGGRLTLAETAPQERAARYMLCPKAQFLGTLDVLGGAAAVDPVPALHVNTVALHRLFTNGALSVGALLSEWLLGSWRLFFFFCSRKGEGGGGRSRREDECDTRFGRCCPRRLGYRRGATAGDEGARDGR